MAQTKRTQKSPTAKATVKTLPNVPPDKAIGALPPGMKRVEVFGHTYRTLAVVNTYTIAAAQSAQRRVFTRVYEAVFPGEKYQPSKLTEYYERHPMEYEMHAQAKLYDVVFDPEGDAPPMSEVMAAIDYEAATPDELAELARIDEHVSFFTRSANAS